MYDIKGKEIEVDPKLQRSTRYRQLCPLLVKLANDASESPEAFVLVHEVMLELSKQVTKLHIKYLSNDSNGDKDGVENHASDNGGKVIGFKKRFGRKISKWIKSGLETSQRMRRTKTSKRPPQASQGQHSQLQKFETANQVHHDNIMLDNSQPSEMTFTNLLLAPLDCDVISLEALDFSQTHNTGPRVDVDPRI
ncbi:uncharacterized protein LOC114742045 [Neltuma alba]|uniref:uncharacterized protein LOC114742045 n=1 Tax=Neltuma alba TaxID=207710 RepID=UPI0010A300CD|nr:uncharacterized protein LOC114742045 [Prosopis alba]